MSGCYDPFKKYQIIRSPCYALQMQAYFCLFTLYYGKLSTTECTSVAHCDMRNIGNSTAKFAFQRSKLIRASQSY